MLCDVLFPLTPVSCEFDVAATTPPKKCVIIRREFRSGGKWTDAMGPSAILLPFSSCELVDRRSVIRLTRANSLGHNYLDIIGLSYD